MSTALSRQVGGSHYVDTGMQPFEFTLANGWDGAAHTILKYLSRYTLDGGREDLEKAMHVAEIRRDLLAKTQRELLHPFSVHNGSIVAPIGYEPLGDEDPRIAMEIYVERNKHLSPEAAHALVWLDQWVRHTPTKHAHTHYCSKLIIAIQKIIDRTYGDPQ